MSNFNITMEKLLEMAPVDIQYDSKSNMSITENVFSPEENKQETIREKQEREEKEGTLLGL